MNKEQQSESEMRLIPGQETRKKKQKKKKKKQKQKQKGVKNQNLIKSYAIAHNIYDRPDSQLRMQWSNIEKETKRKTEKRTGKKRYTPKSK